MDKQLLNVCVDTYRGVIGNYAKEYANNVDEAVRSSFLELLGEEGLTYQSFRRNYLSIFEIIEDSLNIVLPDAWMTSPFYKQFVQTKNGLLGQKNEFVGKDHSVLVASKIAGNHWDTDRQNLIGGKSFSLPTEWINIHVYAEWEKFMKGVVTLVDLYDALREGFQNEIDARIYASFQAGANYLPTEFLENGALTLDNVNGMVSRVERANSAPALIAGTRTGLAKLDALVNTAWVADSAKEEKHKLGRASIWQGIPTLEIPQVFVRGTYDFQIKDNELYVLPNDYQPIKLWYEGDTRTLELTSQHTHDQTFDVQIQTKIGVGVVFDRLYGKYSIA